MRGLRRLVSACAAVRQAIAEYRHQEGTLELEWAPGEAQVDFGEADFYDASGEKRMYKYLCVSFPYSNAGYTQIFGEETAECVAHGLQDLFHRIGGVPPRLVFDNASGVGRRVSEHVRIAEVFLRFKAHYGFEMTFCNPYAGHEKGNVENNVGYMRRNLFVPLPTVTDMQAFNRELLVRCESDWQREHYKKGAPIAMLFEDDKKALLYLPKAPFSACRYTRVKTDGYGKFLVDGKHFYSSSPEWAGKEIVVRIGAHTVEPLAPSGEPISVHIRMFGKQRKDSVDVRTMQELSRRYGFDTALQAMEEAAQLGRLTNANSIVLAARLATFEPDDSSGVDLSVYDKMLEPIGGAQR